MPLSITSGYIVPWTKKSTLPIFLASSSNTLINSSPIIFLFFSGSETPASLDKNLSSAFTLIRFISNWFLNICSTSSPSFLRSRPWSTNIHVSCFPIALCNRTAATEESTPPDKASNTFLSPIFSLKDLIDSSTKEDITQSPEHLQMLYKKFLIIFTPFTVLFTSAWNWIP